MSTTDSPLVRAILVDDNDPRITYRGPWTVYKEDFAHLDNYGPVYRGSQHRLLGGSGELTFTFRGADRVSIYGTTDARNISGTFDPSHICTVDGIVVPSLDPWYWPLCTANLSYAGDHNITLAATSDSTAFYLDVIEHIPDRRRPPDAPTVCINEDDLAVRYLEGAWEVWGTPERAMLTLEAGAKMSIVFNGTRARWIADIPGGFPRGLSSATYSIDRGPSVTFDVPGLPTGTSSRFGQPLFEISDLGPGTHELIVTHNGPAAPLVFDYLVVEDGNIFMSSFGLQNETESEGDDPWTVPDYDDSGSSAQSGGKKTSKGAIIGGVVGGIAVLVAILALIIWARKRKQTSKATAASLDEPPEPKSPLPATYEVTPLFSDQSPPASFQSAPNSAGGDSTQASISNSNTAPPAPLQPPLAHYGPSYPRIPEPMA